MNEQRCHDIDSYFLPGKWGYHRQGSCQAGLGASVADVSILSSIHPYLDQTFILDLVAERGTVVHRGGGVVVLAR